MHALAERIRGGADAVKNALVGLAQSLVSTVAGSPWGGWISELIGAFANQQKAPTPVAVMNEPTIHLAESTSYNIGEQPWSAQVASRLNYTGAGSVTTILNEIVLAEGADEILAAKVASQLYRMSANGGLTLQGAPA